MSDARICDVCGKVFSYKRKHATVEVYFTSGEKDDYGVMISGMNESMKHREHDICDECGHLIVKRWLIAEGA